ATLQSLLRAAEAGSFCLVRGASGFGKSALVAHSLDQAPDEWIVASGKCDRMRLHEPFAALAAPLESVLHQIGDDETLRARFVDAAGPMLHATGGVLQSFLPCLEELAPATATAPRLAGQADEFRLQAALHELLHA